jgi:hypothetical protein
VLLYIVVAGMFIAAALDNTIGGVTLMIIAMALIVTKGVLWGTRTVHNRGAKHVRTRGRHTKSRGISLF